MHEAKPKFIISSLIIYTIIMLDTSSAYFWNIVDLVQDN